MKQKEYNVIVGIHNDIEAYDVMPYLIGRYKYLKKKERPVEIKDIKEFIKNVSLQQYWGRCEWEIIITDWPCQKLETKWDVHQQIMMNIDAVTKIFMENLKLDKKDSKK